MRDSMDRDWRGSEDGHPKETEHLRLTFLLPLCLAFTAIVLLLVLIAYADLRGEVDGRVARLKASLLKHYQSSVYQHTLGLQSFIEMLKKDEVLRIAIERKDRDALLKESKPIFDSLRKISGVTHLYFTGVDRVNLLRVHEPGRHGDVIDRPSMLEAERTGMQAHGVELGTLGILSLRVVEPVYAAGERRHLVGYLELGMELEHTLKEVREVQNVQGYLLIRKQFIQREPWESGMRLLGRTPDWDRFRDFVTTSSREDIPEMQPQYTGGEAPVDSLPTFTDILLGRHAYFHTFSIPLHDSIGRDIGLRVIRMDISDNVGRIRGLILVGGLIMLAIGGVLFVFFSRLTSKVGKQLEDRSGRLIELAELDDLTKLFNKRTFNVLLEKEAARAKRNSTPVSLIMLDIDHFKRINDTYGHVAGDRVIAETSRVIVGHIRDMDSACRYGGEEISVILTETDPEGAVHMAERIRRAIEEHRFDIGQRQNINVTVSIGVASLPPQETSIERLVEDADKALYEAKKGGRNRVCGGGV